MFAAFPFRLILSRFLSWVPFFSIAASTSHVRRALDHRLENVRSACPSGGYLRALVLAVITPVLWTGAHGASVQFAINSGGAAASPFAADAFYTGGSTFSVGSTISTSGVTNPAPATVYQSERYGNFSYTFPGLIAGDNCVVRLHFAETFQSAAGLRRFHVLINGTQLLSNFDIFAEAGGRDKALVKEFTVPANSSGQIVVQFQNGAADNAKVSGIEIIGNAAPVTFNTNLNFDVQGTLYVGTAIAPDTGTFWNALTALSTSPLTLTNVRDSNGRATTYDLSVASSGGSIRTFTNTSLGNPSPSNLMSDYMFGNTHTVTLSKLPAGNYFLYVYAHGDQADQSSTVTVNAANGGGSATTGNTGSQYRNLSTSGALGYSYLRFAPSVGASGTLSFTTTYMNGFQLLEYPKPVITTNLPLSPSAVLNSEFSLSVDAIGEGALTYQWRKGGVALSNGLSASGSTYAGVTTKTLTVTNTKAGDAGNYTVVVTNPGGDTVSATAALTIVATPQLPVVVTPLSDKTVAAAQSVTFGVVANGTVPLTYVWTKGGVPLTNGATAQGSVISGANTPNLTVANVDLADAGAYSVTATNAAGAASSSAALSVNKAPTITTQPQASIVTAGQNYTLTAGFGAASPAPNYSWEKSTDGVTFAAIAGANTASFQVAGSVANSGIYRVVATNSIGSVTSTAVYVGVASSQAVTFGPATGSTGVNPDAPLVVRFPAAPRVGAVGKITVRKVSDDSVAETIDLGSLISVTNGPAIYRFQSKAIGGASGSTYNYFPVVIVGNEARIALKASNTLQYNTAYYVTFDPGVLLDSTGLSIPGISGKTAWAFTTKASAPTAVPAKTSFTVAVDGGGDFSTLQGALDFIPNGNTTPVQLNLRNGIYEEIINYGNRNNITVVGENRDLTIVEYVNNNTLNGGTTGRVSYFSRGNDHTIANLTINNATPKGGSQAEALRSDGARNIFLGCTIKSFQDTVLLGAGNYFQDCLIVGDTDYVWGGGTAMFKNCELRCMNPADLTQARTPANKFGFVFVDCAITKPAGSSFSYSFGRNSADATNFGNTVLIDCRIDTHISAAGWSSAFMTAGFFNNVRNWEYRSTNITGTALVDVSQRASFSRQLTDAEAAILRNPANAFGTTSNGTPAGALGDGWVPRLGVILFSQPVAQTVAPGQNTTLSVLASAVPSPTYQWYKNGKLVPAANGPVLNLNNVQAADVGVYTVQMTTPNSVTTSLPAFVALQSSAKISGSATEVGSNIQHANGNIYDQSLMTGAAASFTADPAQIHRVSFLDLTADVIQVEFSGAGTLTIVLDNPSGPAAPILYNQPDVQYMKGHASLFLTGANQTTNLSVYSVGTANAVNQALFKAGVSYDGVADIALVSIASSNGRFGGLRSSNASYFAESGLIGIHAPGVAFDGPVYFCDLNGFGGTRAEILLGNASDVRVTGGDLLQFGNAPVDVSGIAKLKFTAGTTSHGILLPAQENRAILLQNGVNVTAQLTAP